MPTFNLATSHTVFKSATLPCSHAPAQRRVLSRARAPLSIRAEEKVTTALEPSRIKTKGDAMVTFIADVRATAPVNRAGGAPGTDLATYIRLGPEFVYELNLPLGAKLTRVTEDTATISLPRLDIFDAWVQPTAGARVSSKEGEIRIVSDQAEIVGSEHVEALGLSERYDVYADIKWSALDPNTMLCAGKLTLNVDLPAPFSLMPSVVTKTAGDLAIGTMMAVLTKEFTKSFAADYDKWASSEVLRKDREAKFWKQW